MALSEIFFRLAAGAVVGISVGYVSHVTLDALTPMGVGLV